MTVKVQKSNPVAKAIQNKRYHEKVQDNRRGDYKRSDNKSAINDSIEEAESEYDEFLDEYHDVMGD